MGTKFLLKLILLPVLLCLNLAVIQVQGLIPYALLCAVFCFYEVKPITEKSRSTIVADKVRMNN